MDIHPGTFWMQDNAPSHNSRETIENLERRGIHDIKWPRYSPDLNLSTFGIG